MDNIRVLLTSVYDFYLYRDDDNLRVTTNYDMADGIQDYGLVIQNHYLVGGNVIERLYGQESNVYYDLTLIA